MLLKQILVIVSIALMTMVYTSPVKDTALRDGCYNDTIKYGGCTVDSGQGEND